MTMDPGAVRGMATQTDAREDPGLGSAHRRPRGVDDATVRALGKLGEALECVERARGQLYAVHQLTGHADLLLDGGIPATLFLPETSGDDAFGAFTEARPQGERPAAVVLSHGVSSDRANLSSLARKLAGAGFAVLTLDHRGHGENRNRFPAGRGRADALAPDFAAAVDFLRTSPLVAV